MSWLCPKYVSSITQCINCFLKWNALTLDPICKTPVNQLDLLWAKNHWIKSFSPFHTIVGYGPKMLEFSCPKLHWYVLMILVCTVVAQLLFSLPQPLSRFSMVSRPSLRSRSSTNMSCAIGRSLCSCSPRTPCSASPTCPEPLRSSSLRSWSGPLEI